MQNNDTLKAPSCDAGKQKFRLTNAAVLKYKADNTYVVKSQGNANLGTDFKTSSSL